MRTCGMVLTKSRQIREHIGTDKELELKAVSVKDDLFSKEPFFFGSLPASKCSDLLPM